MEIAKKTFKVFRLSLVAFLISSGALGFVQAETVVHYYTWRANEKKLFDYVSDQSLIPDVKVETHILYMPTKKTYEAHVMLEIINGKVDFFQWSPGAGKLQKLIGHKFIEPNAFPLKNIHTAAVIASVASDGRIYGVPFALQMESLLVNKKMLDQIGVTRRPNSLVELDSAFEKIKQAGKVPLYLTTVPDWYVSQVIAEVMVAGLVEENFAKGLVEGKYCFTSREYQAVFDTLQNWKNRGFLNTDSAQADYQGMNTSVAVGNSTMSFDGGWMTGPSSLYWRVDPGFEFDFWSVPGASNKVYVFGDGSYQVNALSPRSEAARKVLKFTTTKTFAELFAKYMKELPAYAGDYHISDPMLARMAQAVSTNGYGVSMFSNHRLNKGSPSYNELVANGIRGIMAGSLTPEQAVQNIQKGLNSWDYVGAKNCPL